ncbi:hypothetical protein MMC10_006427 [Thelotrema lepadinum]|nr:hypothetical protein [Thelotrema lepadinum]
MSDNDKELDITISFEKLRMESRNGQSNPASSFNFQDHAQMNHIGSMAQRGPQGYSYTVQPNTRMQGVNSIQQEAYFVPPSRSRRNQGTGRDHGRAHHETQRSSEAFNRLTFGIPSNIPARNNVTGSMLPEGVSMHQAGVRLMNPYSPYESSGDLGGSKRFREETQNRNEAHLFRNEPGLAEPSSGNPSTHYSLQASKFQQNTSNNLDLYVLHSTPFSHTETPDPRLSTVSFNAATQPDHLFFARPSSQIRNYHTNDTRHSKNPKVKQNNSQNNGFEACSNGYEALPNDFRAHSNGSQTYPNTFSTGSEAHPNGFKAQANDFKAYSNAVKAHPKGSEEHPTQQLFEHLNSVASQRGLHSMSASPVLYSREKQTKWEKSRPKSPSKRPEPTRNYIEQAAIQLQSTDKPQILLIVLDINGTLVDRTKRTTNFISRPYLDVFRQYCFQNHRVMIWSSAMPENVETMSSKIFVPAEYNQLVTIWGRDKLNLKPHEYYENVQVYKRLENIWDDGNLQMSHPHYASGGRWSQANTILIDDSVDKAAAQPFNHIEVPEFDRKEIKREKGDRVLVGVIGYLERARMWLDVSSFIARQRVQSDDSGASKALGR